ncbi:MAG TPA: imelysin family protein [Rhodothermales bacterium]|nr:imelysin family protein [Rhodothermales bacterium]
MHVLPFALALLALPFAGQASAADTVGVPEVLRHVAAHVITATYADLATETRALQAAVDRLAADPTDATLAETQAAWRAARVPWEQAEGFLFGPVDFEQFDPLIDSWPVNVTDLGSMLGSDAPVDADGLQALDVTLQGFHAAEYLLFRTDSTGAAPAFTPRELAYLRGVTELLARAGDQLHRAWIPGGGDYAAVLAGAGGPGNTTYADPADALYELLMGMLFIVDELGNEKILQPLTAGVPLFVESRFSGNSATDFQNNLRGLFHVYSGTYGDVEGPGVAALVTARDPELDERFRSEVDAAIAALAAIPVPFGEAIVSHRDAVIAARAAVGRVQQTLEEDVIPLLSAP